MAKSNFKICEHITGGELSFKQGIPVFVFHASDMGAVRDLLAGMFVQPEVLFDDQGRLAYQLLVPDRRLLLGSIPLGEQAKAVEAGAKQFNVCMTMIAGKGGQPIDLKEFTVDVDHDWSGCHARGKEAFLAGQVKAALDATLPLRDLPGLARTTHLKGRCFAAMGNDIAALTMYQSALDDQCESFTKKLLPCASTTLSDLGGTLLKLGNVAGAQECLRHSLYLRPNNPEALCMYAGSSGDEALLIKALGRVWAIGGHEAFAEKVAGDYARATGASQADVLARAKQAQPKLTTPFVTGAGLGDLERLAPHISPTPSAPTRAPASPAAKKPRRPISDEPLRGRTDEQGMGAGPWVLLAVGGLIVLALYLLLSK
tara:strand:- start:2412 stop:3524 length:1113 start_codon:yes stop_codon:yes gene_type:complete